jgi:3-methyladenine DNA glycosylase AlkD
VEGVTTLVRLAKKRTEVSELVADIQRRLTSIPSVTTASIRVLRREFSKRIATLLPSTVQLSLELLDKNNSVSRFFACELVQHHQGAAHSLNAESLELLSRGLVSWNAVDMFACYLSGPAWREHQVPDSLIAEWALAKDRWLRRAAVVSNCSSE